MNPILWTAVTRFGTILGVALSLKNLHEKHRKGRLEIHPNRVYNVKQIAILLDEDREEIESKLARGEIKGHLGNRGYRVLGASLLKYLEKSASQQRVTKEQEPAVEDALEDHKAEEQQPEQSAVVTLREV